LVKRSTITDVAKKAGVGKGTVSYVLNGQSRTARISDETAQRVMAAAGELNYRPNALARMLVSQRTDILAVVFQRGYFFTSWSSFTAEVMKGKQDKADSVDPNFLNHVIWYSSTSWSRPYPGESKVLMPGPFVKAAKKYHDDDDD